MAQQTRAPTHEIPIEMHVGEDAGAVGAEDALDASDADQDMAMAGDKPAETGKGGASSGAGRGDQTGKAERGRGPSHAGSKPGESGDVADDDEANQTTENQPS
jgi:hypothetical protein